MPKPDLALHPTRLQIQILLLSHELEGVPTPGLETNAWLAERFRVQSVPLRRGGSRHTVDARLAWGLEPCAHEGPGQGVPAGVRVAELAAEWLERELGLHLAAAVDHPF